MRILILGGTDFIGRHMVEVALNCGHRVTVFHRGRTNPDLFAGRIDRRIGDRMGHLDTLEGGRWDRVVDTSGYHPDSIRAVARVLRNAVGHYTFISTLSVYADPLLPGTDEDSRLHPPLDEPRAPPLTPESYGRLKVACEGVVQDAWPDAALVVRPGLVVGPHDNVPRLPYWVARVARGGRFLAPGAPERLVQVVDARDLAAWTIAMAERGATSVFNVTGEPGALTFGRLLDVCRDATGADAEPVWAPDEILTEEGVPLFDGLPYWVPEPMQGFMRASVSRARGMGITFRPIEETVADVRTWLDAEPPSTPPLTRRTAGIDIRCGLTPDEEARILARLD